MFLGLIHSKYDLNVKFELIDNIILHVIFMKYKSLMIYFS